MTPWPPDYDTRLSGESCALCAEGRPEETPNRVLFYSSDWCDGYLHKHGVQCGFATVIWRGRHAVEPTHLTEHEATTFWLEALHVGRAMEAHYRPLKMNYSLLGNGAPHLHWLIAPRFVDDVAPGGPLPTSEYVEFPEGEIRRDIAALRSLLTDGGSI